LIEHTVRPYTTYTASSYRGSCLAAEAIQEGICVSYLDSPRLHFTGWFQADVSTINNDVRFYQNVSFVPEYQELNQNGSWNPEGTGIFRLLDCCVTGAFLKGQQLTSPTEDAVIGATVQNAADRAPGKLVDLDPQQQMVSEIWGMQVRLVNQEAQTLFQGEYRPAAFINLWQKQKKGVRMDQQLAACYQSVLEGVTWGDTSRSELLRTLRAATHDGMLSIEFNVYGYGRDATIPRYTMGHITGTIGPYRQNEPKHFVLGRQMIAVAPNFTQPKAGVENLQAKLADDRLSLTVDFGNSFPIQDANSGLMDIGRIFVGVLTNNPPAVRSTVNESQVQVIGEVPYLAPGWYTQTAGVQTFNLTSNAAARQLLPQCPLVLLSPAPAVGSYNVLLQESVDGLYVRADSYVFRMDPGETQHVEFYASRFGVPMANAAITCTATEGFMGGSGGGDTVSPTPRPAAAIPSIGTPADAIRYDAKIVTDRNGYAALTLIASAAGPGTPRGYIGGQLYGIAYQLEAQPSGYVSNPMNYVSILVFSKKNVPEHPTWYADIQHLFAQYGNLYPIMGRYVVNLRDYASVVTHLKPLALAFSLPRQDPNHMPVTRDLGAGDRATILKWLETKGHDGLPPLGIPSQLPSLTPQLAIDTAAENSLAKLLPSQGAGKTAVILQLERRGKTAPGTDEGKRND
jgi:hypothetical protein